MARRESLDSIVAVIVEQFAQLVEGALSPLRRKVPEGGLGDIEVALHDVRKTVDGLLLDGLARVLYSRHDRRPLPCACGASLRYVGDRAKTFLTVLGDLRLDRAYYQCPVCRSRRFPLDEHLGVVGEGQSIGIHIMTALTCALLPNQQAMNLLGELGLPHVSESESQRITRQVGARVVGWRDDEARQWSDRRIPPTEHAERRRPRRLAVSMDGTMIHTDGAWHEGKVGAFFAFDEAGQASGSRSYVSTFGHVESFRQLWDTEAQRRRLNEADAVVALCDGAPWTWNTIAEYCPAHTVEVLDFYHATEHLWSLAHVLYGEGSPHAQTWVDAQKARLLEGRLAAFFRALKRWDKPGHWRKEARSQLRYFRTNRHRICYHEYLARGYPIGSGVVEAACKTVLCLRQKQPGMRWRTATAEAIGHLRCIHHSDRWRNVRQRLIAESTQAA
jgi:hypothetical protein